jgi:hypothetical protein
MASKDTREHVGVAPASFGPAAKYARHGSSSHKSGWQETPPKEQPEVIPGERRPRVASEGAVPRTPLAERLRQRVAENERTAR